MRKFFVGNMKLKIFAFLLALLAWIYVNSSPVSSPGIWKRQIILSVQYKNLRNDLRLIESTDQVELVLFEGIHAFVPVEPMRAYVDLGQIEKEGRYFLKIQVELPKWMKLKYQRPEYALILVEEVKK
ncbi:hypothetical protein BBF96_00105 [Anoxybacter fermentans]|uniref:Uncharacterized protein n=1 Tax=Anoxybacter fermentans TaxID=1323375 RepID=A0A3S9SUG5_9FIRM|nr:hypothetical protein [Anoxybacter fermentans]AZR71947.1 hypothetical protein BBF96_00105 [Anoxybacter fermentans]